MTVKRIICAVLVLCLLPACALAGFSKDYVEDFNILAELFGAPELENTPLYTSDGMTTYKMGDGFCGFSVDSGELRGVSTTETGEAFLICSVIMLMVLEGSATNIMDNCGVLFSTYMMCKMNKGEQRTATTDSGILIMVEKYGSENQYMMVAYK